VEVEAFVPRRAHVVDERLARLDLDQHQIVLEILAHLEQCFRINQHGDAMVPFTGSVVPSRETRPVPGSWVNTPDPLGPLRLVMPMPTISEPGLSELMVETMRVKWYRVAA